jgi:ABC-2 type transport system permease protein
MEQIERRDKMRALSVAKRLVKQIGGDKRSIGLLFIAPVFVLFLLQVILTSAATEPRIDIVSASDIFIQLLGDNAEIRLIPNEETALNRLKERSSDAYIIFNNNSPEVTLEGANPSSVRLVMSAINKALTENMVVNLKNLSKELPTTEAVVNPSFSFLYGAHDRNTFDALAPLMMGFFIFFFVFLLAGVSFLRERISGTLERILATPLKRSEIVWGYFLGFGVFVAVQTLIIQLFIVYGLKVESIGSFWVVLLINLLLAAGSLSLGTLLSAFARNEFQLFQFIPIVIVPQILFSGIFDLSNAPGPVILLSKIFPLTYGAGALEDVMTRGYSITDIIIPTLILLGYALLFIFLNILVLKRYRKI